MKKDQRVKIHDESGDRRYFGMIPYIVRARCTDAYQVSLWITVKELCGEFNHPLDWGVRDLAEYAMMSVAKASECRASLAEMGLIVLTPVKDELNRDGYKITIPDLWAENLEWIQNHPRSKTSRSPAHQFGHDAPFRINAFGW